MRSLHFCTDNYEQRFLGSQGILFIDYLIEQRTTNAAYYSKLLKDRVKRTFRSKRRGRSAKSICFLHDNAGQHTAAVTTRTLEDLHWEVLPHPAYSSDLSPCDFHLFGPLKEILGEKDLEPKIKLKFLCNDGWTNNHELFYLNGA
jgi:hypothetical protein